MPKLTTALLNESIDIERYSSTQSLDDRGNINHTWSSNATSVQARVTEARDYGSYTMNNTDLIGVDFMVEVVG